MRDDDTQKRGPAGTPDPATPPDTGHATEVSVTASTDRRPGEWPTAAAALRAKWQREHARRTAAFDAIREHLAEQPSAAAIRSVARRWCRDVTHLADDLVMARQDMEPNE
ncbi:hypothetical protein QA942_01385 [Streptomyces sp. B21-106]|uniref:hypothetical protein n=1 Tax=Streptomyces sp. B21-106 TaxID=3039418 RepID=UPI002FEF0F3B